MVFVVNMDSPSKNQVSTGNTTKPVQEPMNRADQTEPVASDTIFHAYQKATLVGIPIKMADISGLSSHHSDILCRFN
jgi:hypothetical protein